MKDCTSRLIEQAEQLEAADKLSFDQKVELLKAVSASRIANVLEEFFEIALREQPQGPVRAAGGKP